MVENETVPVQQNDSAIRQQFSLLLKVMVESSLSIDDEKLRLVLGLIPQAMINSLENRERHDRRESEKKSDDAI